MLEIKVLQLDVIYSDFGKWVVRTEGLLNHPEGERNIIKYSEIFDSEQEAIVHMVTLKDANNVES